MLFLYLFPVNLIVGVGIYHSVSLLNHSCQPNCVAVFNGTKLMIRVTENIQPGEELTISYTELLAPSFKRKEELRKQYFFDCCCIRCSSAKEEDGLLLSMKCFNSSCNGTVLLLQGILTLWFRCMSVELVGNFRVAFHLCFKASPSVKPFILKLGLFK